LHSIESSPLAAEVAAVAVDIVGSVLAGKTDPNCAACIENWTAIFRHVARRCSGVIIDARRSMDTIVE
jgi:hypothetical protein